MAQYQPTCNVTNGFATVVIPGVDARPEIGAGDGFGVNGTGIMSYQVGAAPTYDGTDTTVTLTAPYGGVTATGVTGVFHNGYTEDGFPIIGRQDLETASLTGRLAVAVQTVITTLKGWAADLSGITDAVTARGNLGLGSAATADVGTSTGEVVVNGSASHFLTLPATTFVAAWTPIKKILGLGGVSTTTRCYVLLARKADGVTAVPPMGFVGRVIHARGLEAASHYQSVYEVNVTSANMLQYARLIAVAEASSPDYKNELCYATVGGVEYVAMRKTTTTIFGRNITIDGWIFGDTAYPQIVDDASVTASTTISAAEQLHTSLTFPTESGYHTATITPSTSGTVTLDSAYNTLSYSKHGDQCLISGTLGIASVSSPVGFFTISLPFAVAALAESSGTGAASIFMYNVVSARIADFMCTINGGNSNVSVYLGDAVAIQGDSAQELKAGTVIRLSVMCRIA